MDEKCPLGYLFGVDWCRDVSCENECPNDTYYACKNKHSSCIGKADFGSKTYAEFQAKQHSNERVDLSAYHCKYCGGWHIGRKWEV